LSRSGHATRRRSRQVALQTLYAGDLAASASSQQPPAIDETFERVATNFDLPQGARAFAIELARGTIEHLDRIDQLLAHNATNWKLSRMAAVDRNVLRLAVFELIATPTPVSIVLDEAIALARKFGTDSSPGFVNGVLDAVAKQLQSERCAATAAEERS